MWLGTLPLIKNEKTLFTIDRQDMEATYMSIGRQMDKKMWYTYTMEYYSAIKKNVFESVLMRWMKLEPII